MKKIILLLLIVLLFSLNGFSATINDSQIIPPDSNIYSDFAELQRSNKLLVFTNNTPISVGELKFYLKQFDYDQMDAYSRMVYDRLYSSLHETEDITTFPGFELSVHPQVNLEGYIKTNKDIPWSFNYYYKDNFISIPLDMGFGNNFAMGANFFLGKSYFAAANNDNYWNIPISFKNLKAHQFLEFYFPTFAYASFGKYNENWGFNVNIGKQGKTIGKTLTGSIIYNSTFETDAYLEFDVYSSSLKYTGNVVQVSSNRMDNIQQDNTERYLYIHQFDIRIFKNLKFSILEGSLIASPFSIRFLNPLPFMHQYGGWLNYITKENKQIYKETNFCADFAYMLEYLPVNNLRLYGIYNQIEMQLPWERGSNWGRYYPNSIGIQLGAEYDFHFTDNSLLKLGLEGFYNSPYMYIKQTPSASLYRARLDMQTKDYVYSWIGSPYGADSAGGMLKVEYNSSKNWKMEFDYILAVKGENDFSLFNTMDDNEDYYNYYPSIKYKLKEKNIANQNLSYDDIYEDAIRMGLTGICQIGNTFKLNGTWFINEHFELSGQIVYNYIVNSNHRKSSNKSGVEFDIAIKYKIL